MSDAEATENPWRFSVKVSRGTVSEILDAALDDGLERGVREQAAVILEQWAKRRHKRRVKVPTP